MPAVVPNSFKILLDERTVDFPEDGGAVVNEVAIVEADAFTKDPLWVVGDINFPALNTVHPYNSFLRLQNVPSGEPIDGDPRFWKFPLTYKTMTNDPLRDNGDGNFKKDKYENSVIAEKSWQWRAQKKSLQYARRLIGTTFSTDTEPLRNTAGDRYQNVPTYDDVQGICTYVRNELFIPATIAILKSSVPTAAVTIDGVTFGKDQICIESVSVSKVKYSEGLPFRTVTYVFAVDGDNSWPFDEHIVSTGFRSMQPIEKRNLPTNDPDYIAGSTDTVDRPQRVMVPDPTSQTVKKPSPSPVFLDSSGREIVVDPNTSWFAYIHTDIWRWRREVNYAPYNFR